MESGSNTRTWVEMPTSVFTRCATQLAISSRSSFVKEPDKNFWTVRVRLGINFANLTYVYVVTSRPKAERDTVEARTGLPLKGGPRP